MVSPGAEIFFCEDLSEEKDGPVGEVGVEGPDVIESLGWLDGLTGKGIDEGFGVELLSRPCGDGVGDGAEGENGGMFEES